MSNRASSILSLFFIVLLAILTGGLQLLALGQEPTNQNEGNTAAKPARTPTPQRRGRRRPPAERTPDAAAPATTPADSGMPSAMPDMQADRMTAGEPTDLSGTYTGTFDCGDAGVSGPTTLTVTGNQFTLADGKTGRLVASSTHGYTAVAMQFGELAPVVPGQPPAPAPMIVSMRARKSGDRLMLMPIEGSGHVCSFGSAAGARTRHRRARTAVTPVTPAEPAMPSADTTVTPAQPAMPATPAAPRRSGRRGGTRNSNTNMNMNTNSSSNTNDNTGTPAEGNTNSKPTPTPPVPRH